MAVIAVCAVASATLRFEFGSFILAAPLAGFLWDVKSGGRGFIGGLIGGVLTLWIMGLGLLAITWYNGGARSWKSVPASWESLIVTGVGATFAVAVGVLIWLMSKIPPVVRYVVNISRKRRVPAKRSEAARSFARHAPNSP